MHYYVNRGYGNKCVTPNNRVLGLGATMYSKDDIVIPLGISTAINGIILTPIFSLAFFADNMVGALPWLLGFGGLLVFQLLFLGLMLIAVKSSYQNIEAYRISNVYRTYRMMDKVTQGEVRPLVRRIEQCVKDGYEGENDLRRRLNKFEEVEIMVSAARKRQRDDSDIEQVDSYIKGMKELKA